MKIKNNIGLEGLFRLQTFKKDSTEVVKDTGWFNNLILDSGLNMMGTSSTYMQYACVGTGSNPPSAAQTSLQTFLVNSNANNGSITTIGVVGANPYYSFQRNTFQFPVGSAAGNLTEVGVRGATNGNIFSRALILDNLGNPTTFTVLGDEILQVTYELRCYPKQDDVVINNVESSPGVTHTVTIRPCNSTSNFIYYYAAPFITSVHTAAIYTGAITAITTSPSGNIGSGSLVTLPYVQNSFKSQFSATWSVNSGNSNNINSCYIGTYTGLFQVGFSPPLVKTSSDILRLDFELSWGRRE